MSSFKWLLDIGLNYFEEESSFDYDDEDIDEDSNNANFDITSLPHNFDPEYLSVKCFSVDEVKKFLNELVDSLCNIIHVTPSESKVLLHQNKWDVEEVLLKTIEDADDLLVASRMKTLQPVSTEVKKNIFVCPICVTPITEELEIKNLACGHCYCKSCWRCYFQFKIKHGISSELSCMALNCELLVSEDIVFTIVDDPALIKQYQDLVLLENIKSHPLLRFCPGAICNTILKSEECFAKKAICTQCKISFCFKCGNDYHAPMDCATLKKWITALSETSNLLYIKANTKNCPQCSIEEDGGDMQMKCSICNFEFCWLCLEDMKTHSLKNCDFNYDSESAKAQDALNKFLFYYERSIYYYKSMQLEKQALDKIHERIKSELITSEKTFTYWKYLFDAVALLTKCKNTLYFAYPHAYFMENGPKKILFEYHQAQLEKEIVKLSMMIENSDVVKRREILNTMHIAQKIRAVILHDY